jgi:serine/threonine-protein kinase haspin
VQSSHLLSQTKIIKGIVYRELDNLRLNDTYKTTGFVEVKSIKCIIGRYPEKLVKHWNIYDEAKTSDNDCPLIFGENQLYIVFELGHGGEDLEAFIFQTAEEAYSLFLQVSCLHLPFSLFSLFFSHSFSLFHFLS